MIYIDFVDYFLSFAIGTALLWILMYVIVNPISKKIANIRYKNPKNHPQKINKRTFFRRVFMAIGAGICMIIGVFIGSYFGLFFIGISTQVRHLPGIVTLFLTSLSGLMIYQGNTNLGLVLLAVASIISLFYVVRVISFNPFVQELQDVTSTLAETDEIKGVFVASSRITMYGLFILSKGILFANLQSSRPKDHLKDLIKQNPKQILGDNQLNYILPYSDIISINMSKGLLRSKISIQTLGNKLTYKLGNHKMRFPSQEEFTEYVSILKSVLGNKIVMT